MEATFRFGIGERLAVVGIIFGVGSLAVGVTFPLAYPDALGPNGARDVVWVGAVLIGASLLFFVCDIARYIIMKRGAKLGTALVIIGIGLIALGAVVGAIGALRMDAASPEAEKGKAERKKASNADGTIKLECSQVVFQFPQDGKLLELIVSDDAARAISFQRHRLSEYAYKSKPSIIPTRYGMIDRCRVTNFGTSPVFNVKITVDANFAEQIPIAERTVRQKQIDRKSFSFTIDQVDAGQNSGVDIYVWNTTRFIVTLMFADRAELQRLGSTEREMVELIPAQRDIGLFPPGT